MPIARWERKKGTHRPSAFGGVGVLAYGSWFLPRGEPRGTDTSPGTAGLWVPGTLRTSCELLILVNQPAKPVAWSDVADLGCGAEPRAA